MKKIILFLTILVSFTIACSESSSIPKPTSTSEDSQNDSPYNFCILSGGEKIEEGWSGNDTGSNYCNKCRCMNGNLACTRMGCIQKNNIKPNPTFTSVPEPTSGNLDHIKRLNELKISNHSSNSIPKYNRSEWNHWIDDDGDCINTRHEVLISESTKDLIMKDKCNVATGNWVDLFTNQIIKKAKLLDVDHMVPLANAHYSGGWEWDREQKKLFANYLGFSEHLIAVSSSANRSKGASGPEKWLPNNELHLCDYASDWISIKHTWDLSITTEEKKALSNIVSKCSYFDKNITTKTIPKPTPIQIIEDLPYDPFGPDRDWWAI